MNTPLQTAPGRALRIDLAYEGTGFAGWQLQPSVPTVQGELERALGEISGNPAARVPVRAAGRTDAGVHAVQQVVGATLNTDLDDYRLRHALAATLPATISPWELRTVDAEFEPRRSALDKTYQYLIDRRRVPDPFLARYALHVPGTLDRAALDDAMGRLPGRKDWAGFTGAASRVRTTVRRLTRATYAESAELGVFSFSADGFLTYMVRNLVGTVLEVAQGRCAPTRIDEVLSSGDRKLAGHRAAAHGLCMVRVRYDEDEPCIDANVPWIARTAVPGANAGPHISVHDRREVRS